MPGRRARRRPSMGQPSRRARSPFDARGRRAGYGEERCRTTSSTGECRRLDVVLDRRPVPAGTGGRRRLPCGVRSSSRRRRSSMRPGAPGGGPPDLRPPPGWRDFENRPGAVTVSAGRHTASPTLAVSPTPIAHPWPAAVARGRRSRRPVCPPGTRRRSTSCRPASTAERGTVDRASAAAGQTSRKRVTATPAPMAPTTQPMTPSST